PSTDKTIKRKISRADVADFMLKQLTDRTYLHETPGLSD
ncbi:MAG: NAD(P)-dependent oxidoreductase, partial [bacterium]|nr:NAD(P)-dependent oxidoreductase [bacterium]